MKHSADEIAADRLVVNGKMWLPDDVVGKHLDLTMNRGLLRGEVLSSALSKVAGMARMVSAPARIISRAASKVLVGFCRAMGKTSLSSRDSRVHFDVAIVLISIIPMLVFTYVLFFDPQVTARVTMFSLSALLAALGYWLIGKYPKALLRLHDCLRQVANGEMPKVACLMAEEKDIVATEHYLNLILEVMRDKIRTIEQQKQRIAEIERKKAIAESLSTACHYLGQPATVIVAYLDLMGRETVSPAMKEMVDQCQIAGTSITRILHTLNEANTCQSEPYLPNGETEDGPSGERILRIEGISTA